MGVFLLRRLLLTFSVLVAVSFVAFAIFGSTLDPREGMFMDPTPYGAAARAFVAQHYHLNDSILTRYVRWAGDVPRHGFGNTVSTDVSRDFPLHLETEGYPIGTFVWRATEISAAIVGVALVFVLIGASAVGILGARRTRPRVDIPVRVVAYLGAAVPTFLIADLLRRALGGQGSFQLTAGFSPTGVSVAGSLGWFRAGPPGHGLVSWVQHLTLPALALAIGLIGIYARYVRSSMLAELSRPYVTVARAKGLPERLVLVRHALRVGLAPFVSLLSLEMGAVIGASIAADGVFGSGGLASTFLSAFGRGDFLELTALVVVSALLVCGMSFIGDALVGVLDPRAVRD